MDNYKKKPTDLYKRTERFSFQIITFIRTLKIDPINRSTISQLIRSSTSIGANYCEADCAESKKDFEHKIGICKKEARETEYWIKMLKHTIGKEMPELDLLEKEAKELFLISASIMSRSRSKEIS